MAREQIGQREAGNRVATRTQYGPSGIYLPEWAETPRWKERCLSKTLNHPASSRVTFPAKLLRPGMASFSCFPWPYCPPPAVVMVMVPVHRILLGRHGELTIFSRSFPIPASSLQALN